MLKIKNLMRLLLIAVITVSMMSINLISVSSATNQFKGVNWADQRDNFVNGVLYVSGLSSSDTYSSAATVADRVVSQFMSLLGSNSVRMPINEPTVSSYWNTYTGAIDMALSKGKVVLAYWATSNGKPANMTDFWNMWSTVINKYGSNSNCYFEPINEPYGYSDTDLCNMYYEFCNRYSSVPKSRIILDGGGYAQRVSAVGGDSRLSGCLLAVHDYSFFVSDPYRTESEWQDHIKGYVGNYSDRTVCTEWGYPNSPGTKNGVYYDYIDYNASSSTTFFYYYARGISKQLRSWNMGSFYWPGLRDGDWYSMTQKSGSGSSITLSIPNASGLYWARYAWGYNDTPPTPGPTPTPSGSYIKLQNRATGLYIDGMGRTSIGSNAAQYSGSSSYNQQWILEASGSYYKIKNRATGLYLDGMGRTSNGSAVGQYSSSSSYNQQWQQETVGSYYKFKNRATGLYIDGMGRTSNGSDLGQYSSSSSYNQQWLIVSP
ncbi:MAG: RICIN domain-containing protein [Firmicutes bacterium]|nr:RICIN domain-containing protein [Bacillota bacterium]